MRADLDPAALRVVVVPTGHDGPDMIDVSQLSPWFTSVIDSAGREHAILSDGFHRIRIEVVEGRLRGAGWVSLRYCLSGVRTAEQEALSLRRLLYLYRNGRFGKTLFQPDPRVDRLIDLLRVWDALRAGASQSEIASVLFGEARARDDWVGAPALRQRVKRMVAGARHLAGGGYQSLLYKSDKGQER